MRPLSHLWDEPISRPIAAEEVLELHAARLLLLLEQCGVAGRIDSLTKMAKLDFFVRYPDFFRVALAEHGESPTNRRSAQQSYMIRYHYGPWDKRYYRLIRHLESRGLILVTPSGRSIQLSLSSVGRDLARQFSSDPSFSDLVLHMRDVKKVLGGKSGTFLKNLVYRLFDDEVGQLRLGEVIQP